MVTKTLPKSDQNRNWVRKRYFFVTFAFSPPYLALPTSAKPIAEFKAGNEKALNSLKGPVMKASKGKANPVVVDELVRKLIATL